MFWWKDPLSPARPPLNKFVHRKFSKCQTISAGKHFFSILFSFLVELEDIDLMFDGPLACFSRSARPLGLV